MIEIATVRDKIRGLTGQSGVFRARDEFRDGAGRHGSGAGMTAIAHGDQADRDREATAYRLLGDPRVVLFQQPNERFHLGEPRALGDGVRVVVPLDVSVVG